MERMAKHCGLLKKEYQIEKFVYSPLFAFIINMTNYCPICQKANEKNNSSLYQTASSRGNHPPQFSGTCHMDCTDWHSQVKLYFPLNQ